MGTAQRGAATDARHNVWPCIGFLAPGLGCFLLTIVVAVALVATVTYWVERILTGGSQPTVVLRDGASSVIDVRGLRQRATVLQAMGTDPSHSTSQGPNAGTRFWAVQASLENLTTSRTPRGRHGWWLGFTNASSDDKGLPA
jgi:hypothetical protein